MTIGSGGGSGLTNFDPELHRFYVRTGSHLFVRGCTSRYISEPKRRVTFRRRQRIHCLFSGRGSEKEISEQFLTTSGDHRPPDFQPDRAAGPRESAAGPAPDEPRGQANPR